MREIPDATGKIPNNLFRISAWSQWARRAITGNVAAGNISMLPAIILFLQVQSHGVLHRGAKRTQNLCGNSIEKTEI